MGRARSAKAARRSGLVPVESPAGPKSTHFLDGVVVAMRLDLPLVDRLKYYLGGTITVKAAVRTQFHPGESRHDWGEATVEWGPRAGRVVSFLARTGLKGVAAYRTVRGWFARKPRP